MAHHLQDHACENTHLIIQSLRRGKVHLSLSCLQTNPTLTAYVGSQYGTVKMVSNVGRGWADMAVPQRSVAGRGGSPGQAGRPLVPQPRQMPLRQPVPSAEQVVPSQQGWPLSPHSSGAGWQKPARSTRSSAQGAAPSPTLTHPCHILLQSAPPTVQTQPPSSPAALRRGQR